jgi:hypothetical protein
MTLLEITGSSYEGNESVIVHRRLSLDEAAAFALDPTAESIICLGVCPSGAYAYVTQSKIVYNGQPRDVQEKEKIFIESQPVDFTGLVGSQASTLHASVL